MITSSKKVTFSQLKNLPAPKRPADAGEYWVGIKHSDLLREVCNACTRKGWEATLDTIALSKDKADMSTSFHILCSFAMGEFELGLITSNARRHALKFFVGINDKEKNFRTVLGEVFVGQKRAGAKEFDLATRIDEALEQVEALAKTWPAIKAEWSKSLLTSSSTYQLVSRIGRDKILPWSRIGKAVPELEAPVTNLFPIVGALARAVEFSPPLSQLSQLCAIHALIQAL